MTDQDYIDYFSGLARKHKQLLHSDKKESFFYAEDPDNFDELQNALRSRLKLPAMVLIQDGGELDDGSAERYLDNKDCSFIILARAGTDKEVRAAHSLTKDIGMSILARMRRDLRPGKLVNGKPVNFSITDVHYAVADIPKQLAGYMFNFTLRCPFSYIVDQTNWTDL